MGSFYPKTTKTLSPLVAYVLALNFIFIYANLQKPQANKSYSQPPNVNLAHSPISNLMSHFYKQAFLTKEPKI